MSYAEDLKNFQANHTYETMVVDGSHFRYVLQGKADSKTLVLLNGGMNTLEMWMGYVDALAEDYQVLLFDYPQELRTNQELVVGMHSLKNLGSPNPSLSVPVMVVWCHRSIPRNTMVRWAA